MRHYFSSKLVVLTVVVSTFAPSGSADAGIILQTASYNGHTYHLVAENGSSERITWTSSEAYAVSLGGHLVTVNDAAENSFVFDTFKDAAIAARASAHPTGGLLSLWIGYNDVAAEGTYVWVGGGGTGYTNWASGEPAGLRDDEDFAAIVVSSTFLPAGKWHDVVADYRFNNVSYGVVEISPAVAVPEPGECGLADNGHGWRGRMACAAAKALPHRSGFFFSDREDEGGSVDETPASEEMMPTAIASTTWLDCLEANGFDEWPKERMVNETRHTYFLGYLPAALAFLKGRFVDLGFENLGLSAAEYRVLALGFGGSGVCIPGTPFRMRFAYPHAAIEPVDGSEPATLPVFWKEAVLVVDDQGLPTWVGKRVRADQIVGFDLGQFQDSGEALTPP